MKEREDLVERILTYVSLTTEVCRTEDIPVDVPPSQLAFLRLPLTYFNEAEASFLSPDGESLPLGGLTASYERNFFDPGEVRIDDVPFQEWDISWTTMAPSARGKTGTYGFQRVRRVPLKEVRGIFRCRTGVVVEHAQALIYNDGTYEPHRSFYEKFSGKWHAVAQPRELERPHFEPIVHGCIEVSRSIAFSRHYDWRVVLAFRKDLPSISLVTDPVGAREIFRLRDLRPGAARRTALRHWVSEHWRKRRGDSVEETKIWAHLRGAQEFNWHGMYCKILPSSYDLKKAAQLHPHIR